MNSRELTALMTSWGRFWASKESLQGYSSVSSIEQCRQVLMLGLHSKSDKHLFSHHADSILPPPWVRKVDKAVELLPINQRVVINRRYVKNSQLIRRDRVQLWHAHVALVGVLD